MTLKHPEIEERVHADLLEGRSSRTGRSGLSGEQVLRIALLKQIHGLSYRELEFHLEDSAAFRSRAFGPVDRDNSARAASSASAQARRQHLCRRA